MSGFVLRLGGLSRLRRAFGGEHSHPALAAAWTQNGTRYLAGTKRRMVSFGRGGGDWKPLADSTLRQRRKGRGAGSARILYYSGALIGSLDVGAEGNLLEVVGKGVKVGFSGAQHPDGGASMAEIATYHDQGGDGGKPPQRQILVEPDSRTAKQMRDDWKRAGHHVLRDAEGSV